MRFEEACSLNIKDRERRGNNEVLQTSIERQSRIVNLESSIWNKGHVLLQCTNTRNDAVTF